MDELKSLAAGSKQSTQTSAQTNAQASAKVARAKATPRANAGADEGDSRDKERRESVVDRRVGIDRRQISAEASGYEGEDRRTGEERRVASATGLERRRGPGRRRVDERRSAEEGEMTTEQFEFCMAIETYKKVNRRMFPTWTEVLEVIQQLGYRKVLARELKLENVPEPKLSKVA